MPERDGLPPAARRWLDRCLPAASPTPARVTLKQVGELESNDRWLRFRATGRYWVQPLAFEWRARMGIMPGMWAIATDGHDGEDGWGGAKLWGLFGIGGRRGPEVQEVQLIRNLAELAWMPDLALSDPALRWVDAGDEAFELHARATTRPVAVRFEVDAHGDVVQASTEARPYDVPDGYEDAPWRYVLGQPRHFGSIRAPASVVATYDLPDGPWEYFRAEVEEMERHAAEG
jgi:hypothetical protein